MPKKTKKVVARTQKEIAEELDVPVESLTKHNKHLLDKWLAEHPE